jgi:hypothetical protein
VRAPWQPPDDAPSPIRSLGTEEFCSAAAVEDKFWRTEVSFLTPCRDGEVPLEPSPSFSIAVSAVSIDLTAISINLAVSHDEEGVVLPRG